LVLLLCDCIILPGKAAAEMTYNVGQDAKTYSRNSVQMANRN